MRKGSILLVVLLMMLGLCFAAAAEEAEPTEYTSGDYKYILLPDGSAEITRYTGTAAELSVPDTLDGHPVTSIGDDAFNRCSLTSITLPEGLTSIGNEVFYNCRSLTSITLPEGLTSIGDLTFCGCYSLTAITLPNSLTKIGANSFVSCDKLTDILVSPEQPVFAVINGVLFNKTEKKLICYPCAFTANEYQVPKDIRSIGDYAFYGCSSLSTITLPDGLTNIGNRAFQFCDNLTAITLPDGLTSIETGTFCQCSNLTTIILPDGLTSIRNSTFYGCRNLTTVTLPDGLTSIGERAFDLCPEDMLFTVVRDSWAAKWCKENGKNYTYTNSLEWLND